LLLRPAPEARTLDGMNAERPKRTGSHTAVATAATSEAAYEQARFAAKLTQRDAGGSTERPDSKRFEGADVRADRAGRSRLRHPQA